MSERTFQREIIRALKRVMPDCIVLKADPTHIQGIPDLIVLNGNRWAALECKVSKNAKHQPNQDYYIRKMNDMSYASFIFPENAEEVLNAVSQSL